jgi:hypothetical protein
MELRAWGAPVIAEINRIGADGGEAFGNTDSMDVAIGFAVWCVGCEQT